MSRRFNNRRFKKRSGNSLLTNKNMRKVLNKTNHISKIEVQRHLFGLTTIALVTAGVIHALTLLGQGDDFDTRQGRKIHARRIQIKGVINNTENTVDTITIVRVILVKDGEQSGVLPVVSSATSVPLGILEVADVNSFKSLQIGSNRYSILYDKRFIFDTGGGVTGNGLGSVRSKLFSVNNKLNFPVFYGGTGATQAEQGKNNLYLLVMTSNADSTISFRSRFEFNEV